MSQPQTRSKVTRVLITGAKGQLGQALQQTAPDTLGAEPGSLELIAVDRSQFDLSQSEQLAAQLQQYKPHAIINAAAFTAVDKAESEFELANRVNALAVAELARWCEANNIPLIQVSTDFVFDGNQAQPYLPEGEANPLGVYAKTKRAGELAALELCSRAYVVRTGWVYGEHGVNFVKTMLRLGAERDVLGVVADQVGTPTYAKHLAQMIWRLLAILPEQKIYHFSDAGVASWYDFAIAIFKLAQAQGILDRVPLVKPITTSDYPTPARRPAYSVLDKSLTWKILDITPCHWQTALADMLLAYQKQQN